MRFHPDLTVTGALVKELSTDLAAMGADITVVTSMPHCGRKDIASEYRGRLLNYSKFHSVNVWRTFIYVPPQSQRLPPRHKLFELYFYVCCGCHAIG